MRANACARTALMLRRWPCTAFWPPDFASLASGCGPPGMRSSTSTRALPALAIRLRTDCETAAFPLAAFAALFAPPRAGDCPCPWTDASRPIDSSTVNADDTTADARERAITPSATEHDSSAHARRIVNCFIDTRGQVVLLSTINSETDISLFVFDEIASNAGRNARLLRARRSRRV